MSGLLLAGDVYIDRFDDNGNATGLVGPINVTQLQVQTPTEQINRPSRKKESYGQALDSVNVAQPTTLSLVIDDQPAELLSMALLGELQTINQEAGGVTGLTLTLPTNQRWFKLPHNNLTADTSAVMDSDDSEVAPSAYEINYSAGLIRATAKGALSEGGAIKLTYGYAALSGTNINGAIKPSIRGKLLLDGRNLATGKSVTLDVPLFSVAPSEAVDFMASEYVSTTLNGNLLLASGETAPFYLRTSD